MFFNAGRHTERNKTKKNAFASYSGGCMYIRGLTKF